MKTAKKQAAPHKINYTNKNVTVSIREMDTGVWAYGLYLAKQEGLRMADFLAKALEAYEAPDTSNE